MSFFMPKRGTMGKTELRNAIFNVVEYLTKSQLSDHTEKLILHYFNDSKEDDAYDRAIGAIGRYCADDIPSGDAMPARLSKLLSVLKKEADAWDDE